MGKICRRIAAITGLRISKTALKESLSSYERGQLAEKTVRKYLQKKGLVILKQNYHGPGGEIDLIMRDKKVIVFIEVRYRASKDYLHPVESVDTSKCLRIIQTSQYYLQKNQGELNAPCRFDVVTVTGDLSNPELRWIKNAFQA